MLGSLATILRMAGWDAAYALDRGVEDDDAIRRQASEEDRVLITRDRQLADRSPGSVLITAKDVAAQVAELREVGFEVGFDEPTRCSNCNGQLCQVPETSGTPVTVPAPAETPVWRCRQCGQHFWKGSHWSDVLDRLGPS